MELAGDSYEMKILCVTEQNYLFFFFSPFPSKGVVGTAPLKSLCFPSSHFLPPGYRGDNIARVEFTAAPAVL